MKNVLTFLSLSLIVIAAACSKSDNPAPSGTITLDKTAINLDTTVGFTNTLIVRSTVPWMATVSSATGWCTLSKTRGGVSDSVLTLTVLSNNKTATPQTATITFSADDNSQTPPVTVTVTQKIIGIGWQKALGGSSDDVCYAMAKTSDGGTVLAGWSKSADGDVAGNLGKSDILVVKLNASGNKQWARTFGGTDLDYATAIVATPDGGYAVAGHTGSSNVDMLVLKLDATGNQQWMKTFGGSRMDFGSSITTTADGGYILAGNTESTDGDVSSNRGATDILVIKLDGAGNKVWVKNFGGTKNDYITCIKNTNDGGYVLAGNSASTDGDINGNHGLYDDMLVLKIDGSGNKVWAKTFGGSSSDGANSIVATADGGYIAAGDTESADGDIANNHGYSDLLVVKLDASGNKQWIKTIGGSDREYSGVITTSTDGGYMLAGSSASTDGDMAGNRGMDDLCVLKLNSSGGREWSKSFGGSDYDDAVGIIPTDGGYVVAAYSSSADGDVTGNHGYFDFWVMKLDF
jgi:hypothetical protein